MGYSIRIVSNDIVEIVEICKCVAESEKDFSQLHFHTLSYIFPRTCKIMYHSQTLIARIQCKENEEILLQCTRHVCIYDNFCVGCYPRYMSLSFYITKKRDLEIQFCLQRGNQELSRLIDCFVAVF
jgi:hypothetical protein